MKIRRIKGGEERPKPLPGDRGFKGSGGIKTPIRPGDVPEHLGKNFKEVKGKTWQDKDTAQVKRIATIVQHEILRCFRDGHLNTGDFQRWVRANAGNRAMFYSWVLKDLIPKSVALSVVGGDGKTPDELPLLVRIEARKEPKK